MKRKAILIGSPGGTPYLHGVKLDLDNMVTFLTSANGGSWIEKDEIVRIPTLNPKRTEIEGELNSLKNYDFAFIYFSGHGYSDSNDNAKINLNESETLFVNELTFKCKRQITIIDACRSYSQFFNDDGGSIGEATQIFKFDTSNISSARQIYDTYLSNCSNGNVLLCAAKVGQSASDTKIGGYFSTNILRSAKALAKSSDKTIVNIYEVFEQAFNRTKDKHQPEISRDKNSSLKFPFVVNPYARIIQSKTNKENGVTLDDIAKLALGVFVIAGTTAIIIKFLTEGNKKG